MLIDEYLPRHDFEERHHIEVEATVSRSWEALKKLDLGRSMLIRALFLARGLRIKSLTLDGLLGYGFVMLGERSNEELLLGLVARPWLPTGGIVRIEPDHFINLDEPGYAKVGWNFSLSGANNTTKVTTETRIACTDASAWRWFGLYWSVVRPFSGVTRMEALKAIKRGAES